MCVGDITGKMGSYLAIIIITFYISFKYISTYQTLNDTL